MLTSLEAARYRACASRRGYAQTNDFHGLAPGGYNVPPFRGWKVYALDAAFRTALVIDQPLTGRALTCGSMPGQLQFNVGFQLALCRF